MLKFWRSRKKSSQADKAAPARRPRSPASPSSAHQKASPPSSSASTGSTTTPLRGLGLSPLEQRDTVKEAGTSGQEAAAAATMGGARRGSSPRLDEIRPVERAPSEEAIAERPRKVLIDRNGRDAHLGPAFLSVEEATTAAKEPVRRDGSHSHDDDNDKPPTTWSEMVSPDLVANLSARERTRQEILWEVVASEERYVAELRSLVEHYSYPLLHPHLTSSSSPIPQRSFSVSPQPSSSTRTLSPYPASPPPPTTTASTSSAELPIASRFSRSPSPQPPPPAAPSSESARDLSALDFAPDSSYSSDEYHHASRPPTRSYLGRPSLPDLPTGARRTSMLTPPPPPPLVPLSATASTGRLASLGSRARDSFFRPASSSSSRRVKLYEAGGAEGSGELARPVPPLPEALRKVLGATIDMLQGHEDLSARLAVDQGVSSCPPWFLHTYTTYIVSLEDALAELDSHLRVAAAATTSDSNRKRLFKSHKSTAGSDTTRIGVLLQKLEEQAAAAGESNMGICLSKPLMRLSKLPLLMQALLYHTAMALEVDALVRSIENEKVEEEDREKARDALARIDGIRDQALMAPRGARILLDEKPAPPLAILQPQKPNRRLSAAPLKRETRAKNSKEWLITFTDVVVRAEKIGETDVPTGPSGIKPKKSKHDKPHKRGDLRNTYRFIGIERWETPEAADEALRLFYERRKGGTAPAQDESCHSEEEDAESQMSFRYDTEEPQPVKPLPRSQNGGGASPRVQTPAPTKFAGRLRDHARPLSPVQSPQPRHHDAPTVSDMLKAQEQRAASPPPPPPPPLPRRREAPPQRRLADSREDSTFGLYSIWAEEEAGCS
ncbi:hypothetical protein C6P46_001943 [Rhodotorula mucilaginosa]|uniref:DH domain-containing protein n=1 Tax=Rhodotorula mucilaginosa TaxID=5537 RepID=A0A9P6W551_RHOMI|nr:hypothetical protein C6P46_001943 [Rhodotorula mucilaginosa]